MDSSPTRKISVSNFQTLDGYNESEDKTFHRFWRGSGNVLAICQPILDDSEPQA